MSGCQNQKSASHAVPIFQKQRNNKCKVPRYVHKSRRKEERDFKLISGAQKIPYNIDGIKTDNECIIVEGEPDVLTFIECGYANVISIAERINASRGKP